MFTCPPKEHKPEDGAEAVKHVEAKNTTHKTKTWTCWEEQVALGMGVEISASTAADNQGSDRQELEDVWTESPPYHLISDGTLNVLERCHFPQLCRAQVACRKY